jgi:hypothetical protein
MMRLIKVAREQPGSTVSICECEGSSVDCCCDVLVHYESQFHGEVEQLEALVRHGVAMMWMYQLKDCTRLMI